MPPPIALLSAISFILFLIAYDRKKNPRVSVAVWIPCLWLLILGSRPVSLWLETGVSTTASADQLLEGSPINRAVYFGLIVLGAIALIRQRVSWSQIIRQNAALALFFLYCGLSVFWSDFPAVAFRRWIKGLGDPIMALIILTQPSPVNAVEFVLKRCAYIMIPLSIVPHQVLP